MLQRRSPLYVFSLHYGKRTSHMVHSRHPPSESSSAQTNQLMSTKARCNIIYKPNQTYPKHLPNSVLTSTRIAILFLRIVIPTMRSYSLAAHKNHPWEAISDGVSQLCVNNSSMPLAIPPRLDPAPSTLRPYNNPVIQASLWITKKVPP